MRKIIVLFIFLNKAHNMQAASNVESISHFFSDINDYRVGPRHLLIDVIVISILASICDADSYVDIANWGKANEYWLQEYLKLPCGIPSHDTFNDIFRMIIPEEFEKCFLLFTQSIQTVTQGDVLAIDGKSLNSSYDKGDNHAAINMVSAWSSLNGTTLGQIKTAAKSNEITAIPELLEMLSIKNCIITIDAAGCQKKITEVIIEKEADYILALKGNQPTLYASAQEHFEELIETNPSKVDFHSTTKTGHGRQEVRNYYVFDDVDDIDGTEGFESLAAIGVSENIRTKDGKTTIGLRFYILSLVLAAEMFGGCVRSHWGVENNLHWCLDVTFHEDASRIRKGNGAENMSIARRIALNLLRNNGDNKKSIRSKRKVAGWDKEYLKQVVGF